MSIFSNDHASSSCSSSTAANALRQLRGYEKEGLTGDIFSRQQIQDIEHGAMQPSTERQTSEDARESSPLPDERISNNGTVQMLPNSTNQTNINNGQQQNAVNDYLSHDDSTTENRTCGCDVNPSTPWRYMPWIMVAGIILLGLLYWFHKIG